MSIDHEPTALSMDRIYTIGLRNGLRVITVLDSQKADYQAKGKDQIPGLSRIDPCPISVHLYLAQGVLSVLSSVKESVYTIHVHQSRYLVIYPFHPGMKLVLCLHVSHFYQADVP